MDHNQRLCFDCIDGDEGGRAMMARIMVVAVLVLVATPATAQRGVAGKGGQAAGRDCAVVFNGKCRSARWLRKREKCAQLVQSEFSPWVKGSSRGAGFQAKTTGARIAMRRCMRGER